jgi:hypothetical protein
MAAKLTQAELARRVGIRRETLFDSPDFSSSLSLSRTSLANGNFPASDWATKRSARTSRTVRPSEIGLPSIIFKSRASRMTAFSDRPLGRPPGLPLWPGLNWTSGFGNGTPVLHLFLK